jgi:hypothetical protein
MGNRINIDFSKHEGPIIDASVCVLCNTLKFRKMALVSDDNCSLSDDVIYQVLRDEIIESFTRMANAKNWAIAIGLVALAAFSQAGLKITEYPVFYSVTLVLLSMITLQFSRFVLCASNDVYELGATLLIYESINNKHHWNEHIVWTKRIVDVLSEFSIEKSVNVINDIINKYYVITNKATGYTIKTHIPNMTQKVKYELIWDSYIMLNILYLIASVAFMIRCLMQYQTNAKFATEIMHTITTNSHSPLKIISYLYSSFHVDYGILCYFISTFIIIILTTLTVYALIQAEHQKIESILELPKLWEKSIKNRFDIASNIRLGVGKHRRWFWFGFAPIKNML